MFGPDAALGEVSEWRLVDAGREPGSDKIAWQRGTERLEWTLDPNQGCAPIRAAYYQDSRLVAECRSTLRPADGVWYPVRAEFYNSQSNHGAQPTDVLEISAASFDKSEHSRLLSAVNLELEVGTNIQWKIADGQIDFRLWDGQRAVSQEEFAKRLEAEEIKYSLRAKRYLHTRGASQPGLGSSASTILQVTPEIRLPDFETEWRRYTREFVERYDLDAEQSQAAARILGDCEEQGRRYVATTEDSLSQLRKRWSSARSAASAPSDQVNKMIGEWRDLISPIERIFEERLKPRLATLPTPSQRARVDPPPASQPDRPARPESGGR